MRYRFDCDRTENAFVWIDLSTLISIRSVSLFANPMYTQRKVFLWFKEMFLCCTIKEKIFYVFFWFKHDFMKLNRKIYLITGYRISDIQNVTLNIRYPIGYSRRQFLWVGYLIFSGFSGYPRKYLLKKKESIEKRIV